MSPVTSATGVSPLERGEGGGGGAFNWPIKTAGVDTTAPRDAGQAAGRGHRVGEDGVSLMGWDDAAPEEPGAREKGGNKETIVEDDGSSDEAEDRQAKNGRNRARGEESRLSRGRQISGEKGIATRSARQQQQQQQHQTVRVVVHEVKCSCASRLIGYLDSRVVLCVASEITLFFSLLCLLPAGRPNHTTQNTKTQLTAARPH